MSPYGQNPGLPPGFNTWPDFQKISWYATEFDDKLSEIEGLNNHIRALTQKEQDALQDAYEFQDKAREWEKKYEEVKHQMDRFRTELPTEVMILRQTVKKAEKEIMLLQGGVVKRDESIQKLRSRLISAKEEYKTEIKLLDDIIDERNNEVNQLRENEQELKATNQALEGCWKFEKGRVDEFKVAADKYDEAGPALERLNKILAKYLGDQLQDGLDWPPGHPNNKSNMNRALDALDNELRKASIKPILSNPPTPTTVSKPPRAIDNPERRNGVDPGGSDVSFRSPTFLAPGQRRRSGTNTSRNSVPPNTTKDLGDEMAGEDLSDDEWGLHDNRSSIDSQRPGSASPNKGGFGSLKDHAPGLWKKGLKEIEHENQSPISASSPPYNPFGDDLTRTPTNDKKCPTLGGLRASSDLGNGNRRSVSMFGNGTAPPEDDSPKPSDKVFADDRKKNRGSRFAPQPIPTPEPIIEYRDKIVFKDRIVEVPLPMQCTKAHVEDQPILSPIIREVEKKVMVPCSRDHLADHTCPTKEVEVIKKVSVPCSLDHVKDQPPVSPKVTTKEVIKEVPAKCTKAHIEDQPPVKPEVREIEKVVTKEVKIPCYLNHVKDQPPQEPIIKEKKVMVPCSRDHLADHTCPTPEPRVVYEEKKVMVPCSRDHLVNHICPTKEVKVPCHLDHCKDHPALKPEIKEVEVIKEVPAKCTKPHVQDQPPVSPKVVYKDRKVMVPCCHDHLREDHICLPTKEVIKEKKVNVPCSRDHVDDIPAIEPRVITKEIEVRIPCTKPHLNQHICPPPQVQTVEKIVERPIEVFVDRPIIQEKIVNKYINTTVYSPRNPLWAIFYIYFDLWTIFIAWMNQNSAFTRSVLDFFKLKLPGRLQNWCVMDPLAGRTFEIIDGANTFNTERNARVALLKATRKPEEDIDAETKAQNIEHEYRAEKEAKNVPKNLKSSITSGHKGKGGATGKATGNDAADEASETRNRKPTGPHATTFATLDGKIPTTMRSTMESHRYEAEYVLATQYLIRRPPLISNLLMAILFTTFFIVFFLASCVVREYSSLLKFQGVIRPSWFTQPWISQVGWYSGGGASLRSGFVVDRDWSWVKYLWEAVARFGWLRQLHFWLETTVSGGAGYRMPG